MPAAADTARQQPMRPPDTLPRDAAAALRVFWRHPSPLLIAAYLALFGGWRIALGDWDWRDAAAALAVFAAFPLNEWLIHVFMLHYRARRVFGRRLDFRLPATHRRHHAEPWNLDWVFIPRHVHFWVLPLALALAWLLPWQNPVLSGITVYLLLGLHYEWVHFLAHIPWCPPAEYYRRRVREHRWHHFRHERYWWGVSFGLADRLLRTAPAGEQVARSGSTHRLEP